jgi:hypothetical protein
MKMERLAARLARRGRPRFSAPAAAVLLPALLAAGLLATLAPRASAPPPQLKPAPPATAPPEPAPQSLPPPPPAAAPEAGCPHGCAEPPAGCAIKGNISWRTGERIYHLPGQRYYGVTVISPQKGEAWFCTEAEARANGWRKSLR